MATKKQKQKRTVWYVLGSVTALGVAFLTHALSQ